MSWTAPRTWADGDIPLGHGDHTDAQGAHSDVPDSALSFNVQIRDNFNLLAIARDATRAKFGALASTYLADLSGTNLTGMVKIASDNTITAKNNYDATSGSGRLVIPAGANKYVESPASTKVSGGLWIEGTTLRWVSETNIEWSHAGVSVGTPAGAVVGSIWMEGNDLHYITESGTERYVPGNTTSMHSDAAALGGSIWMEAYLHWVRQSGTQEYNGSHADVHSDTAHSDVAHVDTHGDAHGDSHTDTHEDTHSDVAHGDSHGDTHHDHDDGI
jgi:hypothetical protein